MTHSWGVKIRGHSIFSLIHTENYHFVGTGIRGWDLSRKPQKLVLMKFKRSTVVFGRAFYLDLIYCFKYFMFI